MEIAHQITVSDQDYAALVDASVRTGLPLEDLVHQAITETYGPAGTLGQTGSYAYPTGELDTAEDEEKDEELARRLGPEKPWLSEMVIEDRGPR